MTQIEFNDLSHYENNEEPYNLLPFRFASLKDCDGTILLSNEVGEFTFTTRPTLEKIVNGGLEKSDPLYSELLVKHFISQTSTIDTATRLLAAKYRTKKSVLRGGPSLHIFVVTLRCDHSCPYCQVSRQNVGTTSSYDLSKDNALASIDIVFSSPAPSMTIEFQGGEPLLAFDQIKFITEQILKTNETEKRLLSFSITTTLHQANEEILSFFKEHKFQISTSLDGSKELHDKNRPKKGQSSYAQTIEKLALARSIVGTENIAALTTLTNESLINPESIIDEYVNLGFKSIFLRPLSPYGFAVKTEKSIGYKNEKFLEFYTRALDYIIDLNKNGILIEEAYTALLLSNILTPFSNGYVDLRSPTGSGLGVLVYNYDGKVYASDESRMLAEMGDDTFCLGRAEQGYNSLMQSEAIKILLASGVAESTAGCSDCAFLPYCGSDPVFHYARYQDPIHHRSFSEHCDKQTHIFNYLFKRILKKDPHVNSIFLAWVTRRSLEEIQLEN